MVEWTMQSVSIGVTVFIAIITLALGVINTSIDNSDVVITGSDINNLSKLSTHSTDLYLEDVENSSLSIEVSSTDTDLTKEGKKGLDSLWEGRVTFKSIMRDIPDIFYFIPSTIFDLVTWIVLVFIGMLIIIMLWRYDGGVLR